MPKLLVSDPAMTASVPNTRIKTGGGRFDPTDRNIYFLATHVGADTNRVAMTVAKYLLIAVNEIETPLLEQRFKAEMLCDDKVTFLDSGVFNLASTFARQNGISHDEALRTPLPHITGFQELYNRYVRLVKENEDRLWGYVEIDVGGVDQKRKTRTGLEALGLRPIPVYHPLNDGWDYFDELASKYDRICVGNVVQASRYVRLRIMATIFERKKAYPELWVHLLGMTPNEWSNAYPMESMDSSSWLNSVRWPQTWKEKAGLQSFSSFSEKYIYVLKDLVSWNQACRLSSRQSVMNQRNWRHLLKSTNYYQGEDHGED